MSIKTRNISWFFLAYNNVYAIIIIGGRMKKKKGFTMVELLATLAIIAALTTLAIVGVNTVRTALKNSPALNVR